MNKVEKYSYQTGLKAEMPLVHPWRPTAKADASHNCVYHNQPDQLLRPTATNSKTKPFQKSEKQSTGTPLQHLRSPFKASVVVESSSKLDTSKGDMQAATPCQLGKAFLGGRQ